jgi:hypothetical protein
LSTTHLPKASLSQEVAATPLRPLRPWPWRWVAGLLGTVLLVGFWLLMRPTFELSTASAALEQALAPDASPQALTAAVTRLEQLAATYPSEPLLYRRLAAGYMALERPEAALAALEQAYRIEPTSLLVQRELALVHATLGTTDPALWRGLGFDAAKLLTLGDQHLRAGSPEALNWYQGAASLEPASDLVARLSFAAALAGETNPAFYASELVHTLKESRLQFNGAELRWLTDRPQYDAIIGSTLRHDTALAARIWWSDQVGLVIAVNEEGRYRLSMQARHEVPAPIIMALGVNGQQLQQFTLNRGDGSAEVVSVVTQLEPGIYLLGVWFLNDGVVNDVNRDAEVDWVAVERIP